MMIWKAIHIMFVIFWMAGLFYLFRLFIYHAQETESVVKTRFQLMEKRLYFYITLPAMVVAVATGIQLILYMPEYYFSLGWFHAKLMFGLLLVLQTFGGWWVYRRLYYNKAVSGFWMRILNESTTVLVVLIVLCAVLEPR